MKSNAAISEKTLLTISERTGVSSKWLLDGSIDSTLVWENKERSGEKRKDQSAGERLKILRHDLDMSQSQFCEMVGMSIGNLASIETERSRLTEQTAKRIESKCGEYGYAYAGSEWL